MTATLLRRMRLSGLAQAGSRAAGGPAELTVSEWKTFALREPISRRSYTIVEIRTKGGLSGYGECASPISPESLQAAIPVVIGQQATSYEVIGRQLATYPGMQAGVVMALLDIAGKHVKGAAIPVARRSHAK